MKYDKQIDEWIEKNRDFVVKEWMDICKVPAIKGTPQKNAPFGKDCANALNKCTAVFENRGFATKCYEDRGYTIVSIGHGEKTIGIFTHSDVVPSGDGWLYTKPFEPIVKDGALIGRGVEDNKSGIMAAFCAMEILREYDVPLKSQIQLFIGSNEESGMEDIEEFIKNHPTPQISLVPDAYFPCSMGEKGICRFYAVSNSSFCDVIDFCGGEAFNIVLDRAVVTLKNSEKLFLELMKKSQDNDRLLVKKEDEKLIVKARGVAKHASAPEDSINAAHILAEFLSNIESLNETDRKIMKEAAKILSCPFGTSLGLDFCDDLFGKLTLVNGIVSLDEGRLKLSFDMRYGTSLNFDTLFKNAEDSFKNLDWSLIFEENNAGFSVDPESKIPKAFEKIYKNVTGFDKKSITLGGGTYARYIKNAFSVGTHTQTANMERVVLKMPHGHGGVHQCDEMIDVESFFNAVKVIFYYLLEMDKEINS